jgi:hypothetical protein
MLLQRNKKIVLFFSALFLASCIFTIPVFPILAQQPPTATTEALSPSADDPEKNKLTNPLGTDNINVIVARGIQIFTGISGSVALAMFVYGGLLWLFSQGDPAKIKAGKEVFKWATIGLVIIFTAYALISQFFKVFT